MVTIIFATKMVQNYKYVHHFFNYHHNNCIVAIDNNSIVVIVAKLQKIMQLCPKHIRKLKITKDSYSLPPQLQSLDYVYTHGIY